MGMCDVPFGWAAGPDQAQLWIKVEIKGSSLKDMALNRWHTLHLFQLITEGGQDIDICNPWNMNVERNPIDASGFVIFLFKVLEPVFANSQLR